MHRQQVQFPTQRQRQPESVISSASRQGVNITVGHGQQVNTVSGTHAKRVRISGKGAGSATDEVLHKEAVRQE